MLRQQFIDPSPPHYKKETGMTDLHKYINVDVLGNRNTKGAIHSAHN